jgi:hypothetical protein
MKTTLMALAFAAGTVGCGGPKNETPGPGSPTAYQPVIRPADFGSTIDNRWLPLVPGTVFRYSDAGKEDIEVTVTAQKRTVMGVECLVVHDVARLAGTTRILEDTFDWFAQDRAGNVWYFGEDTTAYPEGAPPVKDGSWEAGVDGAKPGVVMPAAPKIGDHYRQEYLAGQAEDQAEVLALDEKVTVPFGTFQHCLKTKDYTDLEPGSDENKYYCPGVGNVLTVDVGSGGREELLSVSKP